MSPLNRGPLLGPRMPPAGMRPRFGARMPMPGMPLRMPPPPPMGPMFGPMRQRMMPPRPGGPPPLFGPRGRGVPPLMPPMMCPRGMGPRGPPMRPGLRGLLMPQRPPQGLPHMRPRFPMGNGNISAKAINNAKKVSKLEELELKKPWMTDEIRSEIQKKNKLYAKAKKNKDAKEWNEFKDLRNKVTRMIRDAKNEYLTKNPEQAHMYEEDSEPYDERDENYASSENEEGASYCEVCDREFETAELLDRHTESHKICGIDGCTFSAHPKLVEKHISMQHCTGLYHRMKNLSTPEDIEKWIAERKKKYPTKINMEQRTAEETAKRKRGEVIEEKKSFDRSKNARKTPREKTRKARKRRTRENVPETETLPTEYYRGLRPFAGTADLRRTGSEESEEEMMDTTETACLEHAEVQSDPRLPDLSGKISDDEEESMNSLELSKSASGSSVAEPAKSMQSCLLSLVADYGSDSDDDGPDEVPVKRVRMDPPAEEDSNKVPEIISPVKPTNSTDDEGPEQVPIKRESSDFPMEDDSHRPLENSVVKLANESQVNTSDRHSKATKSRPKQAQRRGPNDKNVKKDKNDKNDKRSPRKTPNGRYGDKKRLMLLQRLLSRSIQHERNIICQCIKYIADNNFFQ